MTSRSVITVVRDSWVFNSLLIALSYVPAVGCTVAYYWLWFAGSKESVARLIWLLVLMLLLMVSFKLLYWLQRTCFFNAKVRLERRRIRKRLHGILQTDNFDLTADGERFVRAYASTETEQSPNHIAGVALLLSVVTFTFGEFNNLLDISQFDITELKFELFFLLLPLFAYAMFLLLRDERISHEKTVRDLALRKLAAEGETPDQVSQTLGEVVRELKAIREQLGEQGGKNE